MRLELKIPRRLESPNTWNGRHWRVKHRLTTQWELEIMVQRMPLVTKPYPNLHGENKMRVSVERHVPHWRNFIRDDDNLRFAVKPLLDALKRQGYIKNDSRKWLDHPTPTQHVSADGKDYTVVIIEPADG